jgi:hypothetical protein
LLREERIDHALAANPGREMTPAQVMLERLLRGQVASPAHHQDLPNLQALQMVSEWLEGLVPNLPSADQIRDQLEWETLLAPFHDLVGDHFAGRQRELDVLANYVEVLDAGSTVEQVKRTLRSVLSIVDQPPLFVYGPGGIGKSTLIAKFVLDHVHQQNVARFPFAYLDFDRPQLVAEEPITLLVEAISQLGMQYPQARQSIVSLQNEWSHQMARESWAGMRLQASAPSSDAPAPTGTLQAPVAARTARNHAVWTSRTLSNRDYYIETFAALVSDLRADDQPLLLVLDTFEEVQLRSTSLVSNVFQFLEMVQQRVPFLRTVLSGRVAVAPIGFKVRELPLETFDLASATAYLVGRTGVDAKTAEAVAKQVTGSPLTLKLAADLLRKREDITSGGFPTISAGFLGELWKGSVTAQLYTRVLKHIADEDVRKLAHPGLALRRITPDIIRVVMAGPCGIAVPDDATANRLFGKLRQEVVLVSERTPGVLVHRPDLRAVMLQALQRAEPERVLGMHSGAVAYYQAHGTTPEERAEEIYHRLSLGLDRAAVESRWIEGLERYLVAGLAEFPPQAQGFLAARLNLTLSPEIWNQADVIDWQRWAVREARECLKTNRIPDAMAILDSRSDWTSPELRSIRVEALALSGHLEQAATVAEDALESVTTNAPETPVFDSYAKLGRAAKAAPPHAARVEAPKLVAGLRDAFGSDEELRSLIERFDLPDVRSSLPATHDTPADMAKSLTSVALTSLAASGGWLPTLVLAARRAHPGNLPLWSFAAKSGFAARGYPEPGDATFEKAFRPRLKSSEIRRLLTIREGQLCRVSVNGGVQATGWLVGPDLVLTSASLFGSTDPTTLSPTALHDLRRRIVVVFDEWQTDSSVAMTGLKCELGAEWLAAYSAGAPVSSDGLGYAVLRIDREIGQSAGADGGRRGWASLGGMTGLPDTRAPREKSFVAMWRFDRHGRLLFSYNLSGVRGLHEGGHRFQYELEADAETAGAIVVDETLSPVALHTNTTGMWMGLTRTRRQDGVPIGTIANDLYRKGIPLIPNSNPS